MDSNLKLSNVDTTLDKEMYQCLVWKLIYLSYTKPDIAFVVSLNKQSMQDPREVH